MNTLLQPEEPEIIRTMWGNLEVEPDVLGFPPLAIDIVRYQERYWTLLRLGERDDGKLERGVKINFEQPRHKWGGSHRTLDEAIDFARKYLKENHV